MNTYYLAIDIGASSGRHMLSWIEDGKICLEEIYRFENGMKEKNGHLCWDLDRLFEEILRGMAVCKQIGKIPVSMGIDTWAVDFVLLDREGKMLGEPVGYRDHRTEGMDDEVYQVIKPEELYKRTGIQKQIFNTIYQLMAVKKQTPEWLEQAEMLLLIPDYFNYLLTGVKKTEYTNATTTQLVNPQTCDWDRELIEKLGYRKSLFTPISMAGATVGHLAHKIQERVGFDLEVIQVASHDTASAVLSVPAKEKDFLYISSGTWSLMGVEQMEADCSDAARQANLTNEGGYEYRYRFLKNIMGLWMIQSVRHEWDDRYSFAELCRMAEACDDFPARVDVNDNRFLSPESMIEAIQEYCRHMGQEVPETPGEISAVIYHSFAESYGRTVKEIEEVTGRKYGAIHIVGGGANAGYLNRLTAKATGKTVYSGPTEATAIGNVVVQMLKRKEFGNLEEARSVIYDSFRVNCVEP
ncbi:rhamnulokinase [Roseburia hominis]